ncbi:MAG TPA: NAD-dependent epimerase/dehydratase family protein [Longimicrobium sp.]|nr:NAD-dependent epimerase/dehydratase family protein [Longimicrobium sp.]
MNVLLYGATGMIGQSVLRECLRDPGIRSVTTVARRATGVSDAKLREVIQPEVTDLSGITPAEIDACFWCLGVSSAGMSEEAYTRVTYELTMDVARPLAAANPAMAFVFVSGVGADSTEKGRVMWARVKGRAENAVLGLGFASAYVIRPAFVLPQHGIRSATRLYNVLYPLVKPLYPILKRITPNGVATGEEIGKAMIAAVRHGNPRPVIQGADIHRLASL